jgi:glycine/D-amino acid oxidase-like deaminating enzyme
MLPHPVTSCMIAEQRFREQLRDAAQQRRAASAESRTRSRPTTGWPVWLAAISWITGMWMHQRGATRGQVTSALERGTVQSA